MLHKTFDLLETKTDSETGTFEATVAVFGNVDRIGDRIMPGAFKNTLAKWAESGDPIPVILSHQWNNPMAHIGVVDEAKETDAGLWVKGTLDVGDNDVARQVHKLMKRRSLKEFSFGYEIPKGGEKRAKDGAHDLTDIELAEVGPTLKGMNPATELHAVKSALEAEEAEQTKALREESERRAREVADEQIPELPPAAPRPKEPEPKQKDDTAALFPDHEAEALKSGELKAVWTTAYINDLPDSAFLYIEAGGNKDTDGKTTPRSLRHFPYKDAAGAVDLPHLRNALSRIPQSSLPQDVKDRLIARAQRLLDNTKSADETDKEPKARSVDTLRKRSEELALEIASDGMSLRKPPTQATTKPEPVDTDELRRQSRDLMFEVLSYSTET